MSREVMLTTIDNPFDPFDQFDQWFQFDEQKGYCTCSYLGRVVHSSYELSEEDQDLAHEQGMDDIILMHDNGLYKKVVRETPRNLL